ncbi:MAG: hypothetical protein K2X87_07375 [Gemmataceae bacterium]|nr:hypothetical protein [Gemmataceae bacterium]
MDKLLGGKLATKPLNQQVQPDATIVASLLTVAGGQVVISDGTYTPNIVGHKFATLSVEGPVDWQRGTYKPVLDPNSQACDRWRAVGTFYIAAFAGNDRPAIDPGPTTVPAANLYTILSTNAAFEVRPDDGEQEAQGPLPRLLGLWEWETGTKYEQKNWSIHRAWD